MKVRRKALNESVNEFWHTFLKPEKSWVNKLYRWFNNDEDLVVNDYVAYLADLHQATFRQEVNFLIRLIKSTNCRVSGFEARFWRNATSERETKPKPARLPTKVQIEQLLNTLEPEEQVFVAILAASGRRSIDIIRINSKQVKNSGPKCFATIRKDKTHRTPVTFSWTWEAEFNDRERMKNLKIVFQNMLENSIYPFENVKVNKIRKRISFRLHGFRHRRAIDMIRKGSSKEDTMSYIGWASESSLTTYIKLSITDLKSFQTLEECINFING